MAKRPPPITDKALNCRVELSESTVERSVTIPVREATLTLTEGEVERAVVDYALNKFAGQLPRLPDLLSSHARADTTYDVYNGHTVILRYDAEKKSK